MFHLSVNKIKIVYYSKQSNEVTYKPNGLWYAPLDAWKKYYVDNINKNTDYKYIYNMVLRYTKYENYDRHKVLKITDEKTFDRFTIRYGSVFKNKYENDRYIVLINWNKVAKRYGGLN